MQSDPSEPNPTLDLLDILPPAEARREILLSLLYKLTWATELVQVNLAAAAAYEEIGALNARPA